jgi:hypothetical protein
MNFKQEDPSVKATKEAAKRSKERERLLLLEEEDTQRIRSRV